MYLSRELWRFTAGVRWRIAWAVLIGLAAVVAGIARLALLGWLLARVLAGSTLPSLLLAVGLVAAVTVLRGVLEYYRTMMAHHTAALVQATLRRTLYAHVAALVPLAAPVLWHRRESRHSLARSKAYAAYGAEFLDTLQGLATLKAFGQSAARRRLLEEKGSALFESTMWVLGSNVLTRGIADT